MYLTLTQFCERVGAPEIVRVTNDRVTETVDPVLFAEWCAGKDDPSFSDPSLPTQGMLDIEVVFDAAEADARETVNSYLQSLYSDKLPYTTTTIPLVIVKAMSNIVRHELHDLSVPDTVRIKYEDTIKWITLISRRTIIILDGEHGRLEIRVHLQSKSAQLIGNSQARGFDHRFIHCPCP